VAQQRDTRAHPPKKKAKVKWGSPFTCLLRSRGSGRYASNMPGNGGRRKKLAGQSRGGRGWQKNPCPLRLAKKGKYKPSGDQTNRDPDSVGTRKGFRAR